MVQRNLRQVSRQRSYSHPHPQVQRASAQGQAAPQVQLQPQEQPWVFGVVSVIVGLRFGAGCPASYIVAFIIANARTPEPLHHQRRPAGRLRRGHQFILRAVPRVPVASPFPANQWLAVLGWSAGFT